MLISILTAWQGGAWTLGDVSDRLQTLFAQQYQLQVQVTQETRYRTETVTDDEGNKIETEVP